MRIQSEGGRRIEVPNLSNKSKGYPEDWDRSGSGIQESKAVCTTSYPRLVIQSTAR